MLVSIKQSIFFVAAALCLAGGAAAQDTGAAGSPDTAAGDPLHVDVDEDTVTDPASGTIQQDVNVNIDPYAPPMGEMKPVAPIDRARAAETTRPMDQPMLDDSDVDVDVDIEQPVMDRSPQFVAIPDIERNRESGLMSGIGTAVSIGGGVSNFTDDTARALTSPGGEWNARAVVGTRSIVALEGAYEGSARNIDAAGLDASSYLVSTGLEGALRLNAPVAIERGLVEPFVFGGLGWQNFNIAGDKTNTSSVDENDNVLTVPVGVGIAGGYGGLHLDGRFTYRYAVGSDMFGPTDNGFDVNSVSNWSLGAGLGFEF